MENEKPNSKKIKILFLLVITLIIIIIILLFLLKLKSTETKQLVPNEPSIIDQIYIPKETEIENIPDKLYKKISVVGKTLTATVDKNGRLQLRFNEIYGGQNVNVDFIKDEVIEVKIEDVFENNGVTKCVFALTVNGDLYSIDTRYGYREDLISKLYSNIVKIENMTLGENQNCVIAKNQEGKLLFCQSPILE